MHTVADSLSKIMIRQTGVSRSQSYENLQGEKGKAARSSSTLGKSRKGAPFRLDLQVGEVFTLAEIDGMGVIDHFFITITDQQENGADVLKKVILRMYWEEEETPSVECPLGDFFTCGNGKITIPDRQEDSPIYIIPARSFHSYFKMPFRRHAKITIENCYGASIFVVAYQVTYRLEKEKETQSSYSWMHFCAAYTEHAQCTEEGIFLTEILMSEQEIFSEKHSRREAQTSGGIKRVYAGVYLSDHTQENGSSWILCLKNESFLEAENVWYEYVDAETLKNGGFRSFRVKNPVCFTGKMKLSLFPIGTKSSEKRDFSSVVYWYEEE